MAIKLDWSKFKKTSSDKACTVLRHDDGHEIRLAHSALSPKMRGELAKLKQINADHDKPQKMAMGGEVKDPKETDDGKKKKTLGSIIGFPGMSKGGEANIEDALAAAGVPAEEAASLPSAAIDAEASKIEQKRDAYNTALQPAFDAAGNVTDDRMGEMFSKSPEDALPTSIDPNAAQKAEQIVQGQAIREQMQAQQMAQQAMANNQAAASMGMAPVSQVLDQGMAAERAPAAQPEAMDPGLAAGQTAAAPTAPHGVGGVGSLMERGVREGESGIRQEASIMQRLAQAEAKSLEVSAADQVALAKDFEQKNQALMSEVSAITQDIRTGQIDPNHVWASKSTPNKIATVIGILASGFGAGMQGGNAQNLALKSLEQEIDRDIDAQKANFSNKNNILNALSTQMGNLRHGTEMLRAIKLGAAAEELKLAAAKAKDPMAKANMMKAYSELHIKAAEQTAKIAANQAKGMRTPAQTSADTEFGKTYVQWNRQDRPQVEKNMSLLKDAMKTLQKRQNDLVGTSGRFTGRLPDVFRSEESIRLRENVQKAAVATLRATLGAQFTEKEGERIMAQSYNEKLSPTENIKKIKSTMGELQNNIDNMESMSNHYEQTGSLKGWQSPKAGEQEQKLLNLAKQRLKSNPNDAAAKSYLQRRGVSVK